MHRPKLLFLSTNLNIGGSEIFLVTLAEKLSEKYDIRIGVLKSYGVLGKHLKDKGFEVLRFRTPWQVAHYLRSNKIDIIQTFLFWAHITGRIAARLAGGTAVITTQQAVDVWKKFYHTFLDTLTAPLCDVFIANSRAAAKRLERVERVPTKKIKIVYNGVDLSAYQTFGDKSAARKELNIADGSFVAVCVSRLHYDKGVDFLPKIALKTPGCTYLVAGDGPYRALLENTIASLGIEKQFIFTGWSHDIPRLLKTADVFILPSREESFPQAALEAMAAGLPVIAADVGGVSELVKNGIDGILITKGDLQGFSAAVNTLLNDPSLVKIIGRAAAKTSVDFGEDKMLARIASIYEEVYAVRKPK